MPPPGLAGTMHAGVAAAAEVQQRADNIAARMNLDNGLNKIRMYLIVPLCFMSERTIVAFLSTGMDIRMMPRISRSMAYRFQA